MKKNLLIFFLIILFSIPAIFPLFHSGFFVTDDGEWMVIRFSAFYQAFADGQFPVRFLTRLNNGFGYPVANFLYPGFMYLGIPINFLGFGFVNTIKIIFGLSMVFSTVFSYLWLSKLFNKYSAFIGSLFYLYTPYHLFDLYKRGSVGEVLALAVVPFILWQIERKSLFFSSVGIATLILSHNTLALLFLPLIIIYKLISGYSQGENKKSLIHNSLFIILSGIGLSAFFWIPAVFELQYTVFSKTSVSKFSEYFADFKLVGFSTVIIFLLTFVFFVTKKIKIQKHRLTLILFIIGILSLFLTTQYSLFLWNILPVSFVQFPYRLLSITILCVSFLSASMLSVLPDRNKIVVGIFLLLLILISSFDFLKPSEFFNKPEGLYATNEGTTTVKDEYLPKWVNQKPAEHFKEKVEIISGQGKIINISYNSKEIEFNINSQIGSKIRVNTIYYPGWKAKIDGVQTEIKYDNPQGVMELSVPEGNQNVNFSFSETPFRLFADILSVISFVVLVVILKFKKVIPPSF